jgi:DNA repair protein RecO
MHPVCVSEGLVLGKRGVGESNTLIFLFTKEYGLLRISARSARKETSKLRYGLEPLTRGRYAFIRGKSEWKLTGVEAPSRALLAANASNRRRLAKVATLLLRLIHGEEQSDALFETLRTGLERLSLSDVEDEAAALECVLVLRILAHLGYLPDREPLVPFLVSDLRSPELPRAAQAARRMLVRAINESLGATGL